MLSITSILFASLAFLEFSFFISASPIASSNELHPRWATLSANSQALINKTVEWQKSTGNQWDQLAAEALLTLVQSVETNGWQSSSCTFDDVYVRKEW
jgi:hypothetical protein